MTEENHERVCRSPRLAATRRGLPLAERVRAKSDLLRGITGTSRSVPPESRDQFAHQQSGFQQQQTDNCDFQRMPFLPPLEVGDPVDGSLVQILARFEAISERFDAVRQVKARSAIDVGHAGPPRNLNLVHRLPGPAWRSAAELSPAFPSFVEGDPTRRGVRLGCDMPAARPPPPWLRLASGRFPFRATPSRWLARRRSPAATPGHCDGGGNDYRPARVVAEVERVGFHPSCGRTDPPAEGIFGLAGRNTDDVQRPVVGRVSPKNGTAAASVAVTPKVLPQGNCFLNRHAVTVVQLPPARMPRVEYRSFHR